MIYIKKFCVLLCSIVLSFAFFSQYNDKLLAFSSEEKIKITANDKSCTFYKWFDPNTNEKEGKLLLKNCSSCHMAYYNEWASDKHSMSQNNPLFLAVYKQFREDHPNQNGNCALCHNPEAALDSNFDVDLRKLKSKKTNGISCDFCHKIESVDQNPLKKGVAGLNILRVCKGMKDVRFGPLKDPIQISDKEELKYNSLFKTSLSCAKCHDGAHGNIPIYSTFTEWVNSPAAKRGVQCQSCHMQPRDIIARSDVNTIVDNPDIKHKIRPYHEVHSHSFLTENPHAFRKKYVDLTVETRWQYDSVLQSDVLIVTCKVINNNFGHSFPTGSPMRNAILLVEAKDKDGNDLTLLKGPRLSNHAGNLKDKSGKLFAKILSETSGEYASTHGKVGVVFRKMARELGIPAQDWWNVFVLSDTRIKSNGNDVSIYEFDVNNVIASPVKGEAIPIDLQNENVTRSGLFRRHLVTPRNDITITAKLIWHNTWPGLARLKGIKLEEDLLIEKKLSLN